MVYKWKTGFHKSDPAVAAAIFNGMASEGKLTAQAVVDASRPEDAPLHPEFEWDDGIAAKEWRKHQARNLVNAVTVIREDKPTAEPIRAFFKVDDASNQYEPVTLIMRNADSKEALKNLALRELEAYRSKYLTILEYAEADEMVAQAISLLADAKGARDEQKSFAG